MRVVTINAPFCLQKDVDYTEKVRAYFGQQWHSSLP